jgi:hypothetical protein
MRLCYAVLDSPAAEDVVAAHLKVVIDVGLAADIAGEKLVRAVLGVVAVAAGEGVTLI